jgi:Ca-activated chloride channel homolog
VGGFGRIEADGPVSVGQLYHAVHGERLLKQPSRTVHGNPAFSPIRIAALVAVLGTVVTVWSVPALAGRAGDGGRHTSAARPGRAAQEPLARFSSGVQLVEVYATVTDAGGEVVPELRADDFEVFEDGRRQAVSTFASGEFPLTVALGVDRSWSMAGEPLRLSKQASQVFLRELKPVDRSMVVAISSDAEVIAALDSSRAAQAQAIAALDPWSTTALHDAIIAALNQLEPERGRQALVVFSDGADRYSTATAADVIARARRSNALIYPIAFGRTRPPLLAELAVLTGGRSFLLRDARELEKTLATVARELRHQYLLGYTPVEPIVRGAREWRSIRVGLRGGKPGLRVRARDGYLTE